MLVSRVEASGSTQDLHYISWLLRENLGSLQAALEEVAGDSKAWASLVGG